MRLLVVEAPGVLYPSEQHPPNADPTPSGLRLVRALTEGFGVSTLIVGQSPTVNHEEQLKTWCRAYDVQFTWTVTADNRTSLVEFWERKVMSFLGQQRAVPPVVLTASPLVGQMLTARGVATIQYRQPSGNAPDWKPLASSWVNQEES